MSLQLSKKVPQAEAYEAMALLLAACPIGRLRDGENAVEYASEACELTKETDWTCLDTLGAAYAEAGDFDLAVKWANRALRVPEPTVSQKPIRERIASYRDKKPYRLTQSQDLQKSVSN